MNGRILLCLHTVAALVIAASVPGFSRLAYAQAPAAGKQTPEAAKEGLAYFEKHIRPVLVNECYSCHSADSKEIEGSLTLDTRAGIRAGGDRGPAVTPGSIRNSLLIEALRHKDKDLAMPPEKKLPAEVIKHFETWISMGAPDPRDGEASKAEKKYVIDIEKDRSFWSFQPPADKQPPAVQSKDWPRGSIDNFVLAALEAKDLKPVEDAAPRTLLRRLHFDLTGLPPSAEEAAKFESRYAEDPTAAVSEVVDRLLASSQFGEKWARHWLDLVRYAESTGKTVNFYYPYAWRYRDYVIGAFNKDKPYDQFIREQLAGDLLKSGSPDVEAEQTIATGFLAIGPKTLNERSGLKFELDVVDEQIDVTTQAFLGITVACARCHDHKFDPFPQTDYYALAGIFRSTQVHYGTVRFINAQRVTKLLPLPESANVPLAREKMSDRDQQRLKDQIERTRESMREMSDPLQRFFTSGRVALLQARLDAYDADGNPERLAMGASDKRAGRDYRFRGFRFGGAGGFSFDGSRTIGDSPVYLRGEPDRPGEKRIRRGALQVMTESPLDISSRTSGRLELANWIADRDNPLTARVMVNRVWQQLFGAGLVPTANDFGKGGRQPTHPELLDHLAVGFMEDGWSVKRLIKRIVTSRVYQLSSVSSSAAMQIDPDNELLWRMAPRRLDAEQLRDAMLAVSGQLDTKPPAGSAVARAGEGPVSQFGRNRVAASIDDPRNTHRSIYLPVIRDNLPEALALFDAADPSLITPNRQQTTVPSQGLYLLNNEFVMRAASASAEKLTDIESDKGKVEAAFARIYGRQPTSRESKAADAFLARYRKQLADDRVYSRRQEEEVWSAFCQALLVSAEFQYRK